MSMANNRTDKVSSTSDLLSAASDSQPLLADCKLSKKSGASTMSQESASESNHTHPPATSTTDLNTESLGATVEIPESAASESSLKRVRGKGDDENDESPPLKKLAAETETESDQEGETVSTATSSANTALTENSGHNADGFVDLKTSNTRSRARSKSMAKQVAANSSRVRGRACASCKKRKIKCRHNTAEEQGNGLTASEQLSPSAGKDEVATTSKITQAKDGDGPICPEAASNQRATKKRGSADVTAPNEAAPPKKTQAKKKAAPPKAKAPPERASTRSRKAPERFETLQEQASPKATPKKTGFSKVFDPVYITTNSTSRLGKADMYHMLTNDETAWTSLSTEQQTKLISLLPDSAETQGLVAKIQAGETQDTRPQYLKASDVFRTEVAKFQADLKNGHLAKTWQAAAEQAVTERAAGEYDAWKAEEAELWWGQKGR